MVNAIAKEMWLQKSLLLRRLYTFLLLKVAFILYFIFDVFDDNFYDDDNNNDILPNLSKNVLKLSRIFE